MNVRLKVDPDRANLSGVTNLDVALSSAAAMSGLPVSTYREARQTNSRSPLACEWRNARAVRRAKYLRLLLRPAISAYLCGRYRRSPLI